MSKANSLENELRVLSCVFLDDVLCSYRKSEKFTVMGGCLKCRHYERFMREMAEEDGRPVYVESVKRGSGSYEE